MTLCRNLLLLAALPFALTFPTDRLCTVASPWKRLQTAIVETIWTPLPHQKSKSCSADLPLYTTLRARYGDSTVLRFRITSLEDKRAILDAGQRIFLDIWDLNDEWVDIRISNKVLSSFLRTLPQSLRTSYTPLIEDLAQIVSDTYPYPEYATQKFSGRDSPTVTAKLPDQGRDLFFREYQPLSVIYPWLRFMESAFPDHAEKISIGLSTEGREIAGLRLRNQKKTTDTERQTILVTGGSHAREWISVSTTNYIAYSLLTRYGRYPGITKLLDEFDVVLIPTINPDGYAYTWETDRLWRKNRQASELPFCKGVDLDRSFGYNWNGSLWDMPCSETFAGYEPFSALESRHLAEWAKNQTTQHNVKFVSFLDFHSYSQQILYPYSYSCTSLPPNLEDLEEVAMGLSKGFRMTYNHFYSVSAACEGSTAASSNANNTRTTNPALNLGTGSALDWFYHELGVKFSYQIKLRDTGSYGFLLPKNNIVPTGQEAFNGVLNLARFLLGNRGIEITEQEWNNGYAVPVGGGSGKDIFYTSEEKGQAELENEGSGEVTAPMIMTDDEEAAFEEELRRRR